MQQLLLFFLHYCYMYIAITIKVFSLRIISQTVILTKLILSIYGMDYAHKSVCLTIILLVAWHNNDALK